MFSNACLSFSRPPTSPSPNVRTTFPCSALACCTGSNATDASDLKDLNGEARSLPFGVRGVRGVRGVEGYPFPWDRGEPPGDIIIVLDRLKMFFGFPRCRMAKARSTSLSFRRMFSAYSVAASTDPSSTFQNLRRAGGRGGRGRAPVSVR